MKAYLVYDVTNKRYYQPPMGMHKWKQDDVEDYWLREPNELCYIVGKEEAQKIMKFILLGEELRNHLQLLEVEVDPELGFRYKKVSQDKKEPK